MTNLIQKTLPAIFVVCFAMTTSLRAQTFTTLVNFNGTDGEYPNLSALTQGRDGNLYGVTFFGGLNNNGGVIFKLSAEGSIHTFYNFCSQPNCADGQQPQGALLLAEDGYLYGTTYQGGDVVCPFYTTCGTAYRISHQGALTTLYSFCTQPSQEQCLDGELPYSGMIQAANQQFYGTTLGGGDDFDCSLGCGTLFKIASDRSLTTLASFVAPDGDQPIGAMIQALDGNLYGTTYAGGVHGDGSIFKSTLEGAITLLYSFDGFIGSEVYGGLVEGTDGNFYGTTLYGGEYGKGIVFKITSSGTLTTVHSFNGTDGSTPISGVIQATDGNFYGTTNSGGAYDDGTIYQMTPQGDVTTLHSFAGTDGSGPNSSLVQGTDGNFYGTTPIGGYQGSCCGTLFRLSIGLSPFVKPLHYLGKVGQTGGILGQGFETATNVAFNGVSATFKVLSDTFLEATIPAGATTGYITVTTGTGTLTSDKQFYVRH